MQSTYLFFFNNTALITTEDYELFRIVPQVGEAIKKSSCNDGYSEMVGFSLLVCEHIKEACLKILLLWERWETKLFLSKMKGKGFQWDTKIY